MGLLLPFQPAADDFPNHLALPQPERPRLPRAGWLLAALVLLCLVPRTMMALRITSICPDGVLYIHCAKAIDSGNYNLAFQYLDFNAFPLILLGIHRLGLDWELGGMIWEVAMSTLVVLPLWGWTRRQFDDRVALMACMLYIIHPKFIEWSPEVMRDPTFWLLFMLSIYWMWRAATEVRYRYFFAAGSTIVVASLIRTEGFFLLLPFALWTFWRWLALAPKIETTTETNPATEKETATGAEATPEIETAAKDEGNANRGNAPAVAAENTAASKSARGKLLRCVVLCAVIFPAILLLINISWPHDRSGWTLIRLDLLERLQAWINHFFHKPPADFLNDTAASLTVGRMLNIFFSTMTRGLTPTFALLMFGGIWGWRRVWIRRDHQPLFYVSLVIMFGIWVQLWYGGGICPRYTLPIVLMAAPFAALGLLGFVARLSRVAEWFHWRIGLDAIAAVLFFAIFAGNLTDALTGNRTYLADRKTAVELGRWVFREFPRNTVLAGPIGLTTIVGYYGKVPYNTFYCEANDDFIMKMIENPRADVVLLKPAKVLTEERCAALAERVKRLGMAPVRADKMPTDDPGYVILVRTDRKDLVE